jgi:predicted dehydrogenase
MTYNIGIVGCGLIGNKRANALCDQKLTMVADINEDLAKKLAEEYNCEYTTDYKKLVESDLDIVIIATSNNMLIPVAIDAIRNGKHVLIEKPGARNPEEMKQLVDIVDGTDLKVKVGFNHRYHPAILKAKEILSSENVGKLLYINARYGHGGRPGYDKEWRAKKAVSGGGEMLDQGCHLIDLGRMFLGDFKDVIGYTPRYVWDMEVEDTGFALLRTNDGKIMSAQASVTHWKNIFDFEIICEKAKLHITGLGKSYGPETLTYHKRKMEGGAPDTTVFTFDGEDKSWDKEFRVFIDAIKNNTKLDDLQDAYKSLTDIYKLYAFDK